MTKNERRLAGQLIKCVKTLHRCQVGLDAALRCIPAERCKGADYRKAGAAFSATQKYFDERDEQFEAEEAAKS